MIASSLPPSFGIGTRLPLCHDTQDRDSPECMSNKSDIDSPKDVAGFFKIIYFILRPP
jgi:hypothetical protein